MNDDLENHMLLTVPAMPTVERDVDVPDDFDPVPAQVGALRAKKQEILAEASVKAANIDEQISRLTCIEHKPGVV